MNHADYILRLQEDLGGDEMPPEWMWPLHWEMDAWLDTIIKKRKSKYGSEEEADDEDWDTNELASEWKKKADV
jgi:hypothetical protein